MRLLFFASILVAFSLTQSAMLKGQSEPPDFPVALEGFGILDPPYFVGENTKINQVQPCEESSGQTDASLCAAIYQAFLVGDALVVSAFGVHENQAFQVKLCKVKSSERGLLLELRHSVDMQQEKGAKFFLRAFLVPKSGHASNSLRFVRIRDANGDHRVQVKEAPKHSEKILRPR